MNKTIIAGVIVGIAAMMMLSVLPALAAQSGDITTIHPPGNDGTRQGVAFIEGDDGSFHVAHTPRDNNDEVLTVGQPVFYTLTANGKHIESISHINPDICTGTNPDECPPPTAP